MRPLAEMTQRVNAIAGFLTNTANSSSPTTLMSIVGIDDIQTKLELERICDEELQAAVQNAQSGFFNIEFRLPDEVSDGQPYVCITPKVLPDGVVVEQLPNGATLYRTA